MMFTFSESVTEVASVSNYIKGSSEADELSNWNSNKNKMKRKRLIGFHQLIAERRRSRRRTRPRGTKLSVGELKFHDLDIDDATVATGGNIAEDSCNVIAQGTTESTRLGRKLTIKNIGWRFRVSLPATSTPGDTSDEIRVILYLDKQANGATATVTGILESSDYQSFNNLANKSRFRILMDRTYSVVSKSGSFDGTNDQFGEDTIDDKFFKRCNIPIEYDNSFSTGVITTIRSNNIGVLLLSFSGLGAFSSKMRLRFSDS